MSSPSSSLSSSSSSVKEVAVAIMGLDPDATAAALAALAAVLAAVVVVAAGAAASEVRVNSKHSVQESSRRSLLKLKGQSKGTRSSTEELRLRAVLKVAESITLS
jgi:hypothetical protein